MFIADLETLFLDVMVRERPFQTFPPLLTSPQTRFGVFLAYLVKECESHAPSVYTQSHG